MKKKLKKIKIKKKKNHENGKCEKVHAHHCRIHIDKHCDINGRIQQRSERRKRDISGNSSAAALLCVNARSRHERLWKPDTALCHGRSSAGFGSLSVVSKTFAHRNRTRPLRNKPVLDST